MEGRLEVEVQDTNTLLWYNAIILDKQDDKFVIQYTDSLFNGKQDHVEESRVRWSPLISNIDIEYADGDYIEVKHSSTEGEPEGWWLARINHRRDKFFFVHYENYDILFDEIVMFDSIRPVNARGGPKLEDIERQSVDVPSSIEKWWATTDWTDKLKHVISKTKVYNITYRSEESKIVIIGEAKPVSKAKTLVDFIVAHQLDITVIDDENSKVSKNIETRKQKIRSDNIEEILVPKDLLGIIIGKSGSNISYIKQEFGVGIHIIEHNQEDTKEFTELDIPEDKALIRISGKDPKSVISAKREIYLQRITIPIEADKIDYIKGYQNVIINDIKEKSRCVKVFLHDPETNEEEGILEAIGNEDSLDDLQMLLETHIGYYNTYKEKDSMTRELSKQMSKISTNYAEASYGSEGQGKSQGNQNQRRRNKKY